MRGFHIDMNGGHYPLEYLETWIRQLAELGYDTILWEVENCIQWETCPGCVAPGAHSKADFKVLLKVANELGLRPIPLLQTIGHAEYVLKRDEYKFLAELPDNISQYCPSNTQLLPFLHRWIGEYYELFGALEYFHIGADEAWSLGHCPKCAETVAKSSLSDLYVNHVNRVIEPILEKGSTPVIWSDMILHNHEAINRLHPEIMVFDWMYDISCSEEKAFVWGVGLKGRDEFSPDTLKVYGRHLFPQGLEGPLDVFYTANYLKEHSRKVVTCSASSSYGDSVFAPRLDHHLHNCLDSMQRGLKPDMRGYLLTSWSVHLFPWELQRIFIAAGAFKQEHPYGSVEAFEPWYLKRFYGKQLDGFWEAIRLTSEPVRWSRTVEIGHSKKNLAIPKTFVLDEINRMNSREKEEERRQVELLIKGYEKAIRLFETMDANSTEIVCWHLAARNLLARAQGVQILLDEYGSKTSAQVESIRSESMSLMEETSAMYAGKLVHNRKRQFISWMYDAFHHALEAKAASL